MQQEVAVCIEAKREIEGEIVRIEAISLVVDRSELWPEFLACRLLAGAGAPGERLDESASSPWFIATAEEFREGERDASFRLSE